MAGLGRAVASVCLPILFFPSSGPPSPHCLPDHVTCLSLASYVTPNSWTELTVAQECSERTLSMRPWLVPASNFAQVGRGTFVHLFFTFISTIIITPGMEENELEEEDVVVV